MKYLSIALSLFVALEHVAFMVLEMFYWTKPLGRKIFRRSEADALSSAGLAKNQGLYNGFLAAGIVYALYVADLRFLEFFLGCVVVAGIYAAITVNKRIFFVQGIPALAAALVAFMAGRGA